MGLSKGFEKTKFKVILGVDNDNASLVTFKNNHKNSNILNADLSDTKTLSLMENLIGKEKVDVIVGGPPCQGFSLTGSKNFDDSRNKL